MQITDAKLAFRGSLATRSKTSRLILHHAEASSCTPQQIHQWHLNNGWSGAGYHFLVRKDGSVYSLRPEGTVGAHASGNNSDSIGICFEGRYMTETMPAAQKKAGQQLVAHLKQKYGISKVQRHSDVCATGCPGTKFPFDEIAKATATKKPTFKRIFRLKTYLRSSMKKVSTNHIKAFKKGDIAEIGTVKKGTKYWWGGLADGSGYINLGSVKSGIKFVLSCTTWLRKTHKKVSTNHIKKLPKGKIVTLSRIYKGDLYWWGELADGSGWIRLV